MGWGVVFGKGCEGFFVGLVFEDKVWGVVGRGLLVGRMFGVVY